MLPAAFLAQLDWLRAHGYRTILPRDLAAHWAGRKRLPARPVILTFDDGFPSWTHVVLPALRSRGMVAEFYLTLDAVARGSISWRDVRALAVAGNGIGAHDVHHIQLAGVPGRAHASAGVMWSEVHDIRAVIKRHIGVAPDSMAYVGGGFDATLMALVRKAGYTTARSILRGIVQTKAHRYRLAVVRIGARDDVVDPKTETLVDGLPTSPRAWPVKATFLGDKVSTPRPVARAGLTRRFCGIARRVPRPAHRSGAPAHAPRLGGSTPARYAPNENRSRLPGRTEAEANGLRLIGGRTSTPRARTSCGPWIGMISVTTEAFDGR